MNKMKKTSSGIDRSTLLGAAFLMATSAIGPGFLTQTATFTEKLGANFGFVILVSVLISLIAQLNIWRVIGATGLRGQELADKVAPGLGVFIAFMVAFGGLVFNIGNVGGAGLGLDVILGLDQKIGTILSALLAIFIFLNKNAAKIIDKLTTVLGALMIVLIFIVMINTKAPYGKAISGTFMPDHFPYLAITTLVGGTVGGYISFSGAHRLLDTGKSGKDEISTYDRSAKMGLGVASLVRVLLFLAVLGVVNRGLSLDPTNPAADAFKQGAGLWGYKFFGIVLFAAALSSVVGCAYTSVSFLRYFKAVDEKPGLWTCVFIGLSSLIMILLGKPASLLVIAGSINGLILPITLGATLMASRKRDIVGEYKHSKVLYYLGLAVVLITFLVGMKSLSGISKLFS